MKAAKSFYQYLVGLCRIDDYQREALARALVANILSYALSIANIPQLVPRNYAFLTGTLGVVFALALPKMLFSIALAIPMVLSIIIFEVIAATAVLAAATVSTGLMVTVFALFTFFVQSIYLSKYRPLGRVLVGFIMAVVALFSLSFLSLAQNGITIPIFSVQAEAFGTLTDVLRQTFCSESGWFPPPAECTADTVTAALNHLDLAERTGWEFVLASGPAAGETVTFSVATQPQPQIVAHVPGGLWYVQALWTERGTSNPLAFFSNFLIASCWAMAVVIIIILIPPVRTIRNLLSRTVVPGTLRALSQVLKKAGRDETGHAMTAEQEQQREKQLIALYNKINVSNAKMLRYEPPFCTAAPFVDLVPYMTNLLDALQHVLMSCLSVTALLEDNIVAGNQSEMVVSSTDWTQRAEFVHKIALAIQLNDVELINEIPAPNASLPEHGKSRSMVASILDKRYSALLQAAKEWIRVTNRSTTKKVSLQDKLRFLLQSGWYLIHTSFLPVLIVANAVKIPRQSVRGLLWAAKWSLGMVGLVCMSVYWPGFANFAIHVTDMPVGSVFHGWQILGYAFSWQVTVEGTFKKGFSRTLGTFLGGFAAWLGIILCSWSYDGTSPINPYAFVAWLSAMALIAVRIGLDPGPAAMMGSSYDVGFIAQYFAMILSILALESYTGMGDINDLTVNRVVATISGVIAAMLVSIIPPFTRGRDPDLIIDYCVWLTKSLDAILNSLLLNRRPINLAEFEKTYMVEAANKRNVAKFFLLDSGPLHFLAYFRIPAEIQQMKAQLVVDESIIYQLADLAASDLVWHNDDSDVEQGGATDWDAVADALQAMLDGKGRKDPAIEYVLADPNTPSRVSGFIRAASNHRDRLIRSTRTLLNLQNRKHASVPADRKSVV